MSEQEKQISILQVNQNTGSDTDDFVAVEEPMEIRVVSGPEERRKGKSLSITMRTPGNDFQLAAGFLFCEGILQHANQIRSIEHCGQVAEGQQSANIVQVELTVGTEIELQKFQRHFYTTSSCGICGKASLEALTQQEFQPVESNLRITADVVRQLPASLRQDQNSFRLTGGIHAAGLFDVDGKLHLVREDVGRHNALDKLIGNQLLENQLPASDSVLVVSGRASFDLLQKALTASIPVFVAVGAPSSLAVDLARNFGITLIGFASAERFNVYSHADRIV